jgi:hypothetical protein
MLRKITLLIASGVLLGACCPVKAHAGDRDTARAIVLGAEILAGAIAHRRERRREYYYDEPPPYYYDPYGAYPRYSEYGYRGSYNGQYFRGPNGAMYLRDRRERHYDPGYRYRGYGPGDRTFDPRYRRHRDRD